MAPTESCSQHLQTMNVMIYSNKVCQIQLLITVVITPNKMVKNKCVSNASNVIEFIEVILPYATL